jgi:hypothetical protein
MVNTDGPAQTGDAIVFAGKLDPIFEAGPVGN